MAHDLPLELAQFDIRPGAEAEFQRELSAVLPLIAAAHGCKGVTAFRSLEQPAWFRLMVRWARVEDHIAFRSTDSVRIVRELFSRFVTVKADTEHLFEIASVGSDVP